MNQDVKLTFKNSVQGEKKLDRYYESLNKINIILTSMNKGAGIDISAPLNKNVKATKDLSNAANGLKKAFNFGAILLSAKKLYKVIDKSVNESSEYIERRNLLDVAFQDNTKEADKFIDKLAEMYALDESTLTNTVGTFKQLANAMGIAGDEGTRMSQVLTQLSIDASSLYNTSVQEAVTKMESALSGQTKAIRMFGSDITESSLSLELLQNGIRRNVDELSFAEKRMVIVMKVMNDLQNSQNDFGRTQMSVSNQIKITSEQVHRLSRAFGNIFYPVLAKILPVLNAFLMVLTEILNVIAGLFGFDANAIDFFDADSMITVEDSIGGIASGLDDAAESAKKLKQGLRGFDKLNNITTPKDGSDKDKNGFGIDPAISGAFNAAIDDYNLKLLDVQNKSAKIRDDIMEWLGFTKIIDKETGKVSFKFDHITGGTVLGALIVGGTIFSGVSKLFKIFKSLSLLKFGNIGSIFGLNKSKNSKSVFTVPDIKTTLKGIADLAIIVGGLTAIVVAIGELRKIPGFDEVIKDGIEQLKIIFLGLSSIAFPLAEVAVLTGIMGKFGVSTFAQGFADLAIIIGGTTLLVGAIGGLLQIKGVKEAVSEGITTIKDLFINLQGMLLPLTETAVLMGGLGAVMVATGGTGYLAIIAGIAALGEIVLGLEAFLVILGAIRQIPGFDWIVGEGGKLLSQLGGIIGEFAGSIINSFINKAFESLPNVGLQLSEFMTNAKPFFEGLSVVDESSSRAAKNIASTILILTASDILDGLFGWAKGESSLSKFGEELEAFGPHFAKYADSIKNVNSKVLESSTSAAKSVAEFAQEIPNQGGLLALLIGDNKLSDFGEELADFGPNFKKYADSVNGINTSVVQNSVDAVKSVIEFAKIVPNKGGLWSLIAGDNTLSDFGEDLAKFAPHFLKYSENMKKIDNGVVTKTTDSVSSIIDFARMIPNQGGLVSLFTGDNKLSDFGRDLTLFGQYYYLYYTQIQLVNATKINSLTEALKNIITIVKDIKDKKLTSVINDFGTALSNFGPKITSFFSSYFSTDTAWSIGYNFGNSVTNGIEYALKNNLSVNLKLTNNKGNNIDNFRVSAYANGGLPSVGQLFVANERGPELVGQIGGQSFVANQNQMMKLLDKKLGNAQQNPTTQIYNIYLDEDHKIATYTLDQLQDMAISNGKPITIGG